MGCETQQDLNQLPPGDWPLAGGLRLKTPIKRSASQTTPREQLAENVKETLLLTIRNMTGCKYCAVLSTVGISMV